MHTYTIVDAITDRNVLPFRIDYVNTLRVGSVVDKRVSSIDTERVLLAPERVSDIVGYTLEHFDRSRREAAMSIPSSRTSPMRPALAGKPKRSANGSACGVQRAVRDRVDRRCPQLLRGVSTSTAESPAGESG